MILLEKTWDETALAAYSEVSIPERYEKTIKLVEVINAAYLPTELQIADARAIIAAFTEAADGAGTVQIDGRMVDRPHLVQAERLLARAAGYAG